jgi:tRNA (guanosine-2'-O-)-methyltransferase
MVIFVRGIMLTYLQKEELIRYLSGFVSENRLKRFDEVLSQRTAHIRVVLEDVYQGHNASAVLRSCDCFGVQHVHFIENKHHMKVNDEVAMGSSNWLTLHQHRGELNNTQKTLEQLKQQGYRIVATTPHRKDHTIDTLPVSSKMALVFGTEIDGITEDVIKMADDFVKIPMYGFTESYNISVSAALCLYEITGRMRKEVKEFSIQGEERTDIYLKWLTNSIDSGELLVKDWKVKNNIAF